MVNDREGVGVSRPLRIEQNRGQVSTFDIIGFI